MGSKIFQVDAFTDQPFKGNPAAVCLLTEPQDDIWMQQVAREMNLSETAFLETMEDGFNLRWFTPAVEVDLCGHATLASAHVLWETKQLGHSELAKFHTKSGILTAEYNDNLIELNFPALYEETAKATDELIAALGVAPIYMAKFGPKFLIEVTSEAEVRELKPDFQALKALKERGVVITSVSSSHEYDFVSRYFAPWVGIDEDPVTGSNHCCLGPFWGKRLNKRQLTAYQASERGGILHLRLEEGRVCISGRAVTVLSGEFYA
jgi:PhzF family phenazine biosynthesis protein